MFTGIVERMGTVLAAQAVTGGRRLRIDAGEVAEGVTRGASVAVGGVCLTVTEVAGTALDFDVIAETLARSTLGSLRVGDRVNLERALRVGDRLDGHFVQGHVDGTATVERVESGAREWVLWLSPESRLSAFLVAKGSVAIEGVSLTIAAVRGGSFSVALIPTTVERTTLGELRPGQRVNIETDILTRTIVHRLGEVLGKGPLSLATLREAGFA